MIKRITILAITQWCLMLPLTLFAQSLRVITPSGGETYMIGRPARIEWTSSGVEGTVRIDLMRNGAQYAEIESGRIVADGSVTWFPWSTIPEANDYYIRLTSNSNMSIVAFSALFTIRNSGAALSITYPVGGETFALGSSLSITWHSQSLTGTLRVDLLKASNLVEVIASSHPVSAGSVSWRPSTVLAEGSNYSIRLVSNSDGSVTAHSGEFSILSSDQPELQLLRPGANGVFSHGDGMQIEWTSRALAGTIGINLRKGNITHAVIAAAVPVADHDYLWIIPDTLPPASDYAIHIFSNSNSTVEAIGASSITINARPRTLALHKPVGGEILVAGDSTLIEWTSQNLTGTVRMVLLKGLAEVGEIVAAHPIATGRYHWVPPVSLANGNDYSILMSSNTVDSVKISTGQFTIVRRELQVLQPAGGEIFAHGDTVRIEWSSQALQGTIGITLRRGNLTRAVIAATQPVLDHRYIWIVPDTLPPANDYAIHIFSNSNSTVEAISASSITIKARPRTLALHKPVGGEILVAGDSTLIEWTSQNLTGTVRMVLLKGLAEVGEIVSAHPIAAGRYKWAPPVSLANGNDYSILMSSNTVDSVKISTGQFTIVRRELQVLQPAGGEIFAHGDTVRIEWSSQALEGTLRINLKKENAVHSVIAAAHPVAERRYNWVLPDSLSEVGNYSIQLISNAMPAVEATSPGPFTIKPRILPVELTRFDVALGDNGAVHLNWETASETNNFGFQVQRRFGQAEFQTIGFVAGNGSTTARRQYQFVDHPGASTMIQYRLRQLDIDGASSFSEIRTVAMAPPAKFILSQNYPNPVRLTAPLVKFDFTLPAEALVAGKIFDLTGRLIETLPGRQYRAGWHSLEWKIPAMTATGIYFFQLEAIGQRLVQKFHLMK